MMLNKFESIPLHDTYGSYNLFEKNKKFYAIPKEIKENPDEIIIQNKAIVGKNKKDLIEILDDMIKWSNSRGTYDISKNKKVYLKANSFSAFDENVSNFFMFPIIFNIKGQLYITDRASEVFKNIDKGKKTINLEDVKDFQFLNDFKKDSHPELIFLYEGFSIVEIDKRYFASKKKITEIRWFEDDIYNNNKIFFSKTIKGVMNKVDVYNSKLSSKLLKHLDLGFQKFYATSYFKIFNSIFKKYFNKHNNPQRLPLNKKAAKIFEFLNSDASLSETLMVFNEDKKEKFVKEFKEFNLFLFEDIYFAIPKKIKDFNFKSKSLILDKNIYSDPSLDNLEAVIQDLK